MVVEGVVDVEEEEEEEEEGGGGEGGRFESSSRSVMKGSEMSSMVCSNGVRAFDASP